MVIHLVSPSLTTDFSGLTTFYECQSTNFTHYYLPTLGLNIYKGESKILQYNTACNNPITLDEKALEDVKTFTYLGSIIDEYGRCDADVKVLIDKARTAYLQLKNIWNSKLHNSINTEVRIFNTNVKTILLYYQQQPNMGENKPDYSGRRYQEEALEEGTHRRHKAIIHHLESSGPKAKRKIKEHITPRNGDRHEKNERESDGTTKEA
ncbi:unnamed protein product [Schistosoma margrebowiei]|uniref:Uncharacterized protein n=1 Tax=Schistosoma margrebowiei TaxID=48269 RepID=A0A183MIC0_9TREM|nr:unnamed protein product [Schistosoma margrebowiei]